MKTIALPIVAALASGLCVAQEVGRVLSSTPVVQQVAIPRQVCSQEMVPVPSQRSGAGAAIGAIAGGALGNAIGQGGGRAAATAIGIFGGAILGDSIEGPGAFQGQNIQRCSTQTVFENRVTSYHVVYEYAGKQYSVQMPHDPGPQVQLQITPVGVAPPPAPANPVEYAAPVTAQVVVPQPVYIAAPPQWYPAYYPRVVRPPIGINLQFGYGGHHPGYWRHRHPR